MKFYDADNANWAQLQEMPSRGYRCGYCGFSVATDRGYRLGRYLDGSGELLGGIYICPQCGGPTFFTRAGRVYPDSMPGESVDHLPASLESLYTEARSCVSCGAYTSAVLTCRKILMHIAVDLGAEPDGSFLSYVNFIADKGYVPPNGRAWVDYIRIRGNEATHEIVVMSSDDANLLIRFVEMILRFNYEFPGLIGAQEGDIRPGNA